MATAQVEQQIISMRHLPNKHIEAALGVSKHCIKRVLKKHGLSRKASINICRSKSSVSDNCNDGYKESGDTAEKSVITSSPVKTLEDVIRVCEIDTKVWKVDRFECGAWTTAMKLKEQEEFDEKKIVRHKPVLVQQYKVKVYLKRILSKIIQDSLDIVFERFKKESKVELKKREKSEKEKFLAVFGLMDVHFGKLAWSKETGENYDLEIAAESLKNSVIDLVDECGNKNIQKIVIPFGNDWMHVDNRVNTTTMGTPQDVDGRFSKVLATAIDSAVWAVEYLSNVADVQVELIPGNHDRTISECLCHIIKARFHNNKNISVNIDPKTRKYVRFGTNLIGLAHGDLVKPDKLPLLMPTESKKDWAETDCHEWIIGHGHRSQKWTTLDTDTQSGVVVRQLRALTKTDLWHYDHGYCGQSPAAEVYFYGEKRGYAGHAVVNQR